MRTFGLSILIALLGMPAAWALELEHLWTLDGFANPESIALAPDGQSLFVSNVVGEADERDGVGYISRISLEGELLESHWANGLNAPKGIDTSGGSLFVSDIDALVEIDLQSASIIERTAIPNAVFLNDVEVASDGAVLVSDSGNRRIYQVAVGEVSVLVEGDWLSGVNGLLFDSDSLLVSTMGTNGLYSFDPATDAYELIAGELGDADGIAILGEHSYLVSEWPGRLFHVSPTGETDVIIDSRDEGILINDFLLVGDVLFVPNWNPGTVTAYRVRP